MAEKEKSQKVTQAFAAVFFILSLLVPPLDFHSIGQTFPFIGCCLRCFVVLGLALVFLVFRENSFTSDVIEVSAGQSVISTGPYCVVRYPLYTSALLMLFFSPLALGSFWGLLFFPRLIVIGFRLVKRKISGKKAARLRRIY